MPKSSKSISNTDFPNLYASDYESHDYFCLNSCGSQVHGSESADFTEDRTIFRPEGRLDYHLLFISSGHCTAEFSGKTVTLNRGDLLFYRPHEPQRYIFSGSVRCSSFWVHFSGTGVPDMVEKAGLSKGNVFHLGDLSAIETAHIRIIVEKQSKQRGSDLFILSYMQLIFALINRALPVNEESNEIISDPRIARVLNDINRMYYLPFDVDACARSCGIGRDRFIHLFKQTVGIPPQRYLTNVRMKNAKRMLSEDDMAIGEVAERCGFTDPLYFSRIFRKCTGVSPSEYKRIFKASK